MIHKLCGRTMAFLRATHVRLNLLGLFGSRGRRLTRQKSSTFNGVCFRTPGEKFQVQVFFDKMMHHVGCFNSEEEAAQAYDTRLRSLCQDPARLKKSLNFPTESEASFSQSDQEARRRGIAINGNNGKKEEQSFAYLHGLFRLSSQASHYEIVRIAGFSRADALFKLRSDSGICLQIKSASAAGPRGQSYNFRNTDGYDGMLLILVGLDAAVLWAIAGRLVTQKSLSIVLGSPRDQAWRVSDIGKLLQHCFENCSEFPHFTLSEASFQCTARHQVEGYAHLALAKVFACVKFQLRRSHPVPRTVDSMLYGMGSAWRVQEKAASARSCRYKIHLWKSGGVLGRVPYECEDFDLLLAAVLDDGQLSGLFAFPVLVLAEQGLVKQRACTLPLYPPWALPKTAPTRMKHAWQLDHFVDLRSCTGEAPMPPEACSQLEKLLSTLVETSRKRLARSDVSSGCAMWWFKTLKHVLSRRLSRSRADSHTSNPPSSTLAAPCCHFDATLQDPNAGGPAPLPKTQCSCMVYT